MQEEMNLRANEQFTLEIQRNIYFPEIRGNKKIIDVKELYSGTREIEVTYLLLSYVEGESHLLREKGGQQEEM